MEYDYRQAKNELSYSRTRFLENSTGIAFNTHINDMWNEYLPNATLSSLGEAHPTHCYYVEPIPKELLGHYIKLFYWQTIQWRGDQLPNGTWIATDRYKELLKDCLNEGKIKDENNPLIQMALMFAKNVNGELVTSSNNEYREIYAKLNFEEGIEFANRYEELYELCIDDEERYELYWDSLKKLLMLFVPILKKSYAEEIDVVGGIRRKVSIFESEEEMINAFIDSYINKPQEYIGIDMRDLDYDADVFNGYKMPQWYTQDYMEIDQMALSGVETVKAFLDAVGEGYDKIFNGSRRQYTQQDKDILLKNGANSKIIHILETTIGLNGYLNDLLDDHYFLNTDNRMLYTTQNPYGAEFTYKPNKIVMNDAITKGKWFKLPPGWSLICIEPIIDESIWGGKRWEDGRPFDWGYSGDENGNKREVQQLYDYVYEKAKNEFFLSYPRETLYSTENVQTIVSTENMMLTDGGEPVDDDELFKFNIWYEKVYKVHNKGNNYFAKSLYRKYRLDAEYDFLKIIHSIWSVLSPYFKWSSLKGVYIDPDTQLPPQQDDYDITGYPLRCINGDISDWWWYACNYLWANFPPIYWGAADMLNDIKIKYTPLFY